VTPSVGLPPWMDRLRREGAARWSQWTRGLRKPVDAVGLDIGPASVRGVRLQDGETGPRLTWCGRSALPSDGGRTQRVQAIREFLAPLPLSDLSLATALGGPDTALRTVILPKMSPEELSSSLGLESEKYIPFPSAEAVLDHAILGPAPNNRMEVLLAAVRKKRIEQHLELLEAAGLHPAAVDLEGVALCNAWERSKPPGQGPAVEGLAHIGERGTHLLFFQGGRFRFSREISAGRPSREQWISECRASFDFYEDQFGQTVGRLWISGEGDRPSEVSGWIQSGFGVEGIRWDPIGSLPSEGCGPLDSIRAELGVALGLAWRFFDSPVGSGAVR